MENSELIAKNLDFIIFLKFRARSWTEPVQPETRSYWADQNITFCPLHIGTFPSDSFQLQIFESHRQAKQLINIGLMKVLTTFEDVIHFKSLNFRDHSEPFFFVIGFGTVPALLIC